MDSAKSATQSSNNQNKTENATTTILLNENDINYNDLNHMKLIQQQQNQQSNSDDCASAAFKAKSYETSVTDVESTSSSSSSSASSSSVENLNQKQNDSNYYYKLMDSNLSNVNYLATVKPHEILNAKELLKKYQKNQSLNKKNLNSDSSTLLKYLNQPITIVTSNKFKLNSQENVNNNTKNDIYQARLFNLENIEKLNNNSIVTKQTSFVYQSVNNQNKTVKSQQSLKRLSEPLILFDQSKKPLAGASHLNNHQEHPLRPFNSTNSLKLINNYHNNIIRPVNNCNKNDSGFLDAEINKSRVAISEEDLLQIKLKNFATPIQFANGQSSKTSIGEKCSKIRIKKNSNLNSKKSRSQNSINNNVRVRFQSLDDSGINMNEQKQDMFKSLIMNSKTNSSYNTVIFDNDESCMMANKEVSKLLSSKNVNDKNEDNNEVTKFHFFGSLKQMI
jgi:hypothetical protein